MSIDVSATIVAKSDQLNADDLVGGPITVQITGVRVTSEDQPVAVAIAGRQPWKPCKTMRRVLTLAWGSDASAWIGQRVTLFRDPSIRFGAEDVGGIRIAAMTGIPKRISVSLAASKGKKARHTIEILTPIAAGAVHVPAAPTERSARLCAALDVCADAATLADLEDQRARIWNEAEKPERLALKSASDRAAARVAATHETAGDEPGIDGE